MQVLKKIWNWLFGKKEVDKWEEYKARKLEEINLLKKEVEAVKRDLPKYATGGYISPDKTYEYVGVVHKGQGVDYTEFLQRGGFDRKIGVNQAPTTPRPNFTPPPQNPSRDFKREADEHFRQQARRDSEDNFLTGAMVGYVIVNSLNDTTTRRDVEEIKSSSSDSSYTPSNSSSYDSESYSSSSDSGSSSSSCDSGC